MNVCDAQKMLGARVREFLFNVPSANEESITDYLVWQWRLLDRRFHYINVTTHSHYKESKISGSDFEMELWLVGRSLSLPLLFQAKKLVKPYSGYVRKLRYPNGSKRQLDLLLKYAIRSKRHPFYAFYAVSDQTGGPGCACRHANQGGVFIVAAQTVVGFADGAHGKRVSKGALLRASRPFHCWLCCDSLVGDYVNGNAKLFAPEVHGISTSEIPAYVAEMLSGPEQVTSMSSGMTKRTGDFGLPPVRRIGVYDFRREG